MRRKFYSVLRAGVKALTIIPENTRIVPLRSEGSRPPFYMVDSYPYFIDLVKQLGADQPVMSLIGHEEMLAAGSYSIQDEAARHIQTIIEHQPEGPYMVGGCSASGIVAFEIAQQMRALGRELSLLVLFDTSNPRYMREYSIFWMSFNSYREDWQRLLAHQYPAWAAQKCMALFARKTGWLNGALGVNGGRDNIGPSDLRIDFARKYQPAPYLGDVLLFKRTGPFVGRYRDRQFGWGDIVRGALRICPVGALDHLEVFKSAADRFVIAGSLRGQLEEIAAASSIGDYRAATSFPNGQMG